MLTKLVFFCLLGASVLPRGSATDDLDYQDGSSVDEEGRLFVIPIGGTTTTLGLFNFTTLAALASVLASALITLLGLGALGFLLYSLLAGGGSGYGSGSGGYGGNGGYSSYSSYRR